MISDKDTETEIKESAPDLLGDLKKAEVVADSTPAIITDHKFRPKGAWYTLCDICNIAESAHEASELRYYSDEDGWNAAWDDE